MEMLETGLLVIAMVTFYFIGKVRGWNTAMKAMKSTNTPTPHVLWDGRPNAPDA